MAQPAFRVTTKPTFRDVAGRFARAEEELVKAKRDSLRTEGRYIVDIVTRRLRAKLGQPSKIEKGIRFNTREAGDNIRLSVTVPGRARPHRIQAKTAGALAFFWPKVGLQVFVPRRGGFKTHVSKGNLFVGKGYVDHPGGSLEPLMKPILEDASDEWLQSRGRVVLNKISTRYVQELTR